MLFTESELAVSSQSARVRQASDIAVRSKSKSPEPDEGSIKLDMGAAVVVDEVTSKMDDRSDSFRFGLWTSL